MLIFIKLHNFETKITKFPLFMYFCINFPFLQHTTQHAINILKLKSNHSLGKQREHLDEKKILYIPTRNYSFEGYFQELSYQMREIFHALLGLNSSFAFLSFSNRQLASLWINDFYFNEFYSSCKILLQFS